MNLADRREMKAIKEELGDIIKELRSIANDIEWDRGLSGIGTERCSKAIREHAEKCQRALDRLEEVDMAPTLGERISYMFSW